MTVLTDEWQDLGDGFEARMGVHPYDSTPGVLFRKGDLKGFSEIREGNYSEDEIDQAIMTRLDDWKFSIRVQRSRGNLDDYDENGFLINNTAGE